MYVLALNKHRKILFRWRCISLSEARRLSTRVHKYFSHCLTITVTDRREDNILFNVDSYDKTQNFTYEQNKYWYNKR